MGPYCTHMDTLAFTSFLTELSANNDRVWFTANKPRYGLLREDFVRTLGQLIPLLRAFDPVLPEMEPAACLFRINRDVRFSTDKSPYKTTFSAAFPRGGSSGLEQPSYYFHVDARGQLMVAGGLYAPGSEQLAAIRQSVSAHPDKLRGIIANPAFQNSFGLLGGDTLKRPPRGYSADNPAADLLKHKGFAGIHTADASTLEADNLVPHIAAAMRAAHPLLTYLRELTPTQIGG